MCASGAVAAADARSVRRTDFLHVWTDMGIDAQALGRRLNQTVQLRFQDGEVVKARLLGLDAVRDMDLTYEVVEVVAQAEPPTRGTTVGATIIAKLADLQAWHPTA